MKQSVERAFRGPLDGRTVPAIRYPPVDDVARARPTRRGLPRGPGQGVLVVEEDVDTREGVRDALEDLGYQPTLATSVDEALMAVEDGGLRPDVLLTDLVLPELSGVNLARRLSRTVAELAVLFVSGHSEETYVDGALIAPGTALIHIPFEEDDLAEALDYLLARRGRR